MSYETLMVQLELGRSNAAQLGVTHELAKRMGSTVCGVAAAQPIQVVVGDGFYGGELVRQEVEAVEAEAKTAEKEFRSAMHDHADQPDWRCAMTAMPLSYPIAGLVSDADLIVVGVAQGTESSSGTSRRLDVDDLVMRVGRPVLAVPHKVKHFGFHCALVAWKDTREARRALADALPMLRQMDRVVLAAVVDMEDRETAQAGLDRMVAWLGRHSIAAESRLIAANGSDGDRLLDIAKEEQADLIVAGAYGHSRFREWVMGGVTRNLLHHSGCCVFLSH